MSTIIPNVVPGSDGSGIVISIGSKVTRFSVGDKVLPLISKPNSADKLDEIALVETPLGSRRDGTFREYGVFPEDGLVSMPQSLTWREGATLACSGLTAWNALFGLSRREVKKGDVVLVQGTGSVSMFALQLAKAIGAVVIATTGSAEKAERLRKLDHPPDHIIDYAKTPEWGEVVKKLAGDGKGVDFIIEVGGPATMEQSFKALRFGGIIAVIGAVGGKGKGDNAGWMDILRHGCLVRGVLMGNRRQFEEMNTFIDERGMRPVLDEKTWDLVDLKEAYEHLVSFFYEGRGLEVLNQANDEV